jgi:hypothetical protein
MFDAFQVLTLLLVAIAMTTALGHALEFPGKLRLERSAYMAVQPIYYPGFTVAGLVGEAGGMLATLIMTVLTWGSAGFPIALGAFLAMVVMHAIYWMFTHPVNNFWLEGTKLGGAGSSFFSFGARKEGGRSGDWKKLRDRWEYSHVARSIFATLAFLLLAILAVR